MWQMDASKAEQLINIWKSWGCSGICRKRQKHGLIGKMLKLPCIIVSKIEENVKDSKSLGLLRNGSLNFGQVLLKEFNKRLGL